MHWTSVWVALVTSSLAGALAAAGGWKIQYFYDKNDSALSFVDFQFPSARRGFALGFLTERRHRRPVLAATSDGGARWDLLPLKDPGISLFFLDEKTGWLVGEKNRVFKTADGGRSWTPAPIHGARIEPLRVFFLDASRGFLLCRQKQVLRTMDGGRSWELLPVSRKPDLPDGDSVYDGAAASKQGTVLLTGWSAPPERAPPGDVLSLPRRPTSSIILRSSDGGAQWDFSVLRNRGAIARAQISPAGSALLVLRHPDSRSGPASEIMALDLKTLRVDSVYADRARWLTDVAFAGPGRAFAAAIENQGRAPFPMIPAKLRILSSGDGRRWDEMEVDYRAEASNALFAVDEAGQAWLATDTGMILKLAGR
jgi:hypothetical protein